MKLLKKIPLKFNIYLLKELSSILFLSLGILTFILVLSRLGKIADLVINKGVGFKDIFALIAFSVRRTSRSPFPWLSFFQSSLCSRLSTENAIRATSKRCESQMLSGHSLRGLISPSGGSSIQMSCFPTAAACHGDTDHRDKEGIP